MTIHYPLFQPPQGMPYLSPSFPPLLRREGKRVFGLNLEWEQMENRKKKKRDYTETSFFKKGGVGKKVEGTPISGRFL